MGIFSRARLIISLLFLIFLTFTISPSLVTAVSKPQVLYNLVSKLQNVSVQLNGYVNPGGLNTTYRFIYGTSTSYGKITGSPEIGSGTSWIKVNAGLFSLSPNTTYYYRLEASNSAGTTYGEARSFRTYSSPQTSTQPSVSTGAAYKVTSSSAMLSGTINPNGDQTSWSFRYGKTSCLSYTESLWIVGSREPVSVSTTISSLEDGTTYYYCLYGRNSEGQTIGEEKTFTTVPIAKVLPLPTDKTSYPNYSPIVLAETGINPPICKPIGVGSIAEDGETVAVEIKLENPSGPYDAYLALNAPAIDPDEYFMLGADGSFHPFSQSGLVKWKKSASGKIDEQPFGSFLVSQLPGGDYNFKFMLTPANFNDKYYLWQTSFSAPETVIDVPDGSAGYFNGTLVVPNATIIYQGQEYEESAPLADDAIVGISKNGQTYLYHPAMGVAELSDYNSRRAVGFFMLGVSASEAETMRTQQPQSTNYAKTSETLRSASSTEAKVIGVGQTVQLETGIDIKLLDNNGTVEATNKARRFSVVKTSENYLNKYYLPPRSNVLPSEIVTLAEDVYKLVTGQIGIQSTYVKRSDIEASSKVETFGAYIRAYPVYKSRGGWGENQKKAWDEDPALTIDINAVDFIYCLLDLGKSIGGLFPSDCADLLVSSGLFKGLQVYMSYLLEDPALISQIGSDALKSMASDFIGCLFDIASLHTAECFNTALDIVSAFNWVVEDVAWRNFLAYFGKDYDAYDLAILGTKNMMAYSAATIENRFGKLVMRNLEDGSSWDINTINNPEGDPEIVGITDDGTVVLFINTGWGGDYDDQLIAVPDWGRSRAIDLLPVPKGELRKIDILHREMVDVTGSGLVVFEGIWYDDDSRYHNGICKIWINDEHSPGHVFFDTHPDSSGEDRVYLNALGISRDAQKLVFSERSNLHSSHHTGTYRHLITSLGGEKAKYINVSDSGDVALFSYPAEWGKDETNVLYSVSLNSYETTNLTVATGLTTLFECAKASPDGKWIATIALDPSRPGDSIQQKRIVLIRPGDGYYRWLDTGNMICTSEEHLCFTADSKSVIFAGIDYTAPTLRRYRDVFAVDIDELHPNLRNLTNTPDIGESAPVLR